MSDWNTDLYQRLSSLTMIGLGALKPSQMHRVNKPANVV
jgi:hypothetical protein